jgi:hypothetical protein
MLMMDGERFGRFGSDMRRTTLKIDELLPERRSGLVGARSTLGERQRA